MSPERAYIAAGGAAGGPVVVSPRSADLSELRARIRALEIGAGGARLEAVPLGAALDGALPWGGLLRGALHEVAAEDDGDGAATGFAAGLLARIAGADGPPPEGFGPQGGLVLWCLGAGDLYAPGLAAFGLDAARLVVVRARRPAEVLWVLEEALASGRFAAVAGEGAAADLVAGRRLQLAARARGTACLLIDRAGAGPPATAALSRWRVAPAPAAAEAGGGIGRARWRVELARCRGGAAPRRWTLEWCHETSRFAVAALVADRPSVGRSRLSVGEGRPRRPPRPVAAGRAQGKRLAG